MRRCIVISWHRFYDPETGRYISADPIGLAGGMNLYAYVGGNPVNWIDPEGLYVGVIEGIKWGGGLIIAAMAANKAKDSLDSTQDAVSDDQCQNKCNATDTRSQAFDRAIDHARPGPGWREVPWSQFNKSSSKADQIKYTEFRQNIGGDPYGYQSPSTGGEIVEHPADADHPCPHFHAKKNYSDSGQKFPYKPGT